MNAPYLIITNVGSERRAEGTMSFRAGSRAKGPFLEWNWDGDNLFIANDRHGFWPAYYSLWQNGLAVSTSLPQLVQALGLEELDYEGMAAFLRLGFFLGDQTAIKGIRALPPAANVTRDGAVYHVGSNGSILRKEASLTRDATIDGFLSLFSQAIRKRAPEGPFAVPLSGGRDSRHILLELLTGGCRPTFCITVGQSGTDIPIASQLADAAQVPHHVVNQDSYGFAAERRKNELTSFGTREHRWMLAITEYMRGKVNHVYDGLGGGVLSAGAFSTSRRIELFRAGRVEELAEDIMPRESERLLRRLLPAAFYEKCNRESAMARLVQELARYCDTPNPVSAFFLANRTRRNVALAPLCLAQHVGTLFCPYMDVDVVEFLLSLRAEMFVDHTFHSDAIRRRFPKFAHIPFEEKKHVGGPHKEQDRRSQIQPRYSRSFARQLLYHTYNGYIPRSVQSSFVLPRLIRACIDKQYAHGIGWLLTPTCYLVHLERLCLGKPFGI